MPGTPFPRLVRLFRKPWDADAESATPHSRRCSVCHGDREPGAYCAGCVGYAPFDEVLAGQASKAEAKRPRTLALAKHYLGDGAGVAEVAAVLGLSEEEVFRVNEELEAALEGRAEGQKRFVPKGIKRLNRRARRGALLGRVSA